MYSFASDAYGILLDILSFWDKLRDDENGGFYGQVDNDLNVDHRGTKGVILHSRILWFYSQCAVVMRHLVNTTHHKEDIPYYSDVEKNALRQAQHAYKFLTEHCIDRENGGVYWMMNFDGTPNDTMKHTYNQAFAVYALSTYYLAAGDDKARGLAFDLFDTIETKCTDDISYMEAFDRYWHPIQNDALSENGIMAEKTMNTVLHLIEAYTVLYSISRNKRVEKRLRFLLDIVENKIYDKENKKLFVFFDREYNVLGDIHSYGHDIEASWLIDRACSTLGDAQLKEKWAELDNDLVCTVMNTAFEVNEWKLGSLGYERDGDKVNKKRVWWVQAEAVVGLVNSFEHFYDPDDLVAAESIINFIIEYQKDHRPNGGEWWAELTPEGEPIPDVTMVNEWKCPYHNGRMCFELLTREPPGQE